MRENIAVGAHLRLPGRADALAAAEAIARRVNLGAQLDKPAADLTVCGRKRLELARALATRPRLLLLDEVLAGLNPAEIDEMIPVVRQLAADGVTVLMIEHVMRAVMSLAAQVWVLAQGRLIAQGTPAQVTRDAAVVEAYLGHGAAARLAGQGGADGRRRDDERLAGSAGLRAGYGRTEVLRGVDLSVGQGEIVVLLGSNGAGKSTLNNTCADCSGPGAARALRRLGLTGRHYRDVVRAGLIQVPEGRRVFPNLSVRENLELGSRGAPARGQSGTGAGHLSPVARAPGPAGRLHVRRRTADAGHRPGPDGRAQAADPGRTSLGLSPLMVEELFALIARLHRAGLSILLVEQNVASRWKPGSAPMCWKRARSATADPAPN